MCFNNKLITDYKKHTNNIFSLSRENTAAFVADHMNILLYFSYCLLVYTNLEDKLETQATVT